MVDWRDFLNNLLDNHHRDIEVNSTRIEDIEDSLRELRSRRARMSDKHKIFKINCAIGELNTRLGNLREEKDGLHEKKYRHNYSEKRATTSGTSQRAKKKPQPKVKRLSRSTRLKMR